MALYEFKRDDAIDFARFINAQVYERGDELFFKECPYCHGRGKNNEKTFSINLKTGQFNCFRAGCGVKGNMITLSRDFDFDLGEEVDEYYRPKRQFVKFKQPEKPIEPQPEAITYLESRGISPITARKYEITNQLERPEVLVFPFFDETGKMQFIKYRNTKFDPEKDNNKEWCQAGGKPILFGMKQCTADHSRLVITEGQLDSLSVAEAGIDNAVSVPNGVKGFTWVPYCYNWVNSFDKIVVFGDHEKGHISLLDEMQKRWPGKIMHVQEADYRDCKDANDILRKYGARAVRDAVENAIDMPVERIIRLADVEDVNVFELPKLRTGISQLDNLLYGGLPFGEVCLITGKRGEGKSTLASQIALNSVDQGYPTLVYSGEMPNYLFKSSFDFQAAGPYRIIENRSDGKVSRFISNRNQALIDSWYQNKMYIYDNRIIETDEQDDLLKTLELAIAQYGIKVAVVDNLMTALSSEKVSGTDKYDKQGYFVQSLVNIALRHDCLILLVAHQRKNSQSDDFNDTVSGSADITNLAGVVLGYNRGTPEDEKKGMEPSQRKLIVSKNRLFGRVNFTGMILDYDDKSKRIYGTGDDVNHAFGWDKLDNDKSDLPKLDDLEEIEEIDFGW